MDPFGEPPPLELEVMPLLDPDTPLLEPEIPLLDPENPLLDPETPLLDPEPPPSMPLLDPEPPPSVPLLDPERPLLDPVTPPLDPELPPSSPPWFGTPISALPPHPSADAVSASAERDPHKTSPEARMRKAYCMLVAMAAPVAANRTLAEMIGETLREAALLVAVFGWLDRVVQEEPFFGEWAWTVMGLAAILYALGVLIERLRAA
jgi:hypothetical protein